MLWNYDSTTTAMMTNSSSSSTGGGGDKNLVDYLHKKEKEEDDDDSQQLREYNNNNNNMNKNTNNHTSMITTTPINQQKRRRKTQQQGGSFLNQIINHHHSNNTTTKQQKQQQQNRRRFFSFFVVGTILLTFSIFFICIINEFYRSLDQLESNKNHKNYISTVGLITKDRFQQLLRKQVVEYQKQQQTNQQNTDDHSRMNPIDMEDSFDSRRNNNKKSIPEKHQSSSKTTTISGIFPPPLPQITRNNNHNDQYNNDDIPQLLSKDAIEMCTKALWHTIETTTIVLSNQETFIHTGDIDDLWLRDSAGQVHPYLIPFFKSTTKSTTKSLSQQQQPYSDGEYVSLVQMDDQIHRIVSGLIRRHVLYIHHDPYANAFRIDNSYQFTEQQKLMGRHDLISTWNYELDSGCYSIRLFYYYYQNTMNYYEKKLKQRKQQNQNENENDTKNYESMIKNNILQDSKVLDAIEIMIDLWFIEQHHEDDSYIPRNGSLQDCLNCGKPYRYPGLVRNGKGSITNSSSGLIWTGFRPSDDECVFHYLIPANFFTIAVLEYCIEMIMNPIMWIQIADSKKHAIRTKAQQLRDSILLGITTHAIIEHDEYGLIYAYEVNGLGDYLFMDDANVPSLLSIPYLLSAYPHHYNPIVYENTKRFILSKSNPYYHTGMNSYYNGTVSGIGSPHMESRIHDNIWPMSLAMQGLVSTNITEKIRLIELLVNASGGTLYMHESFNVQNPKQYTRSWFCWADSLFAELVMSVSNECPNPIHKYKVLQYNHDDETNPYIPGGYYSTDFFD